VTVDDIAAAIFERLCDRQRAQGPGAAMSLAELRLALGVSDAQLAEAIRVLRISDDLYIAFSRRDPGLTLGPSWRGRCEAVGQ
jgi:hypothetical protein